MIRIKYLSFLFLSAVALASCSSGNNAQNILGKWQGTCIETCGTGTTLSAITMEFTPDQKFTVKATPSGRKPIISTGHYIIERYKLTFINTGNETYEQKISTLNESVFETTITATGCSSITKLRKIGS